MVALPHPKSAFVFFTKKNFCAHYFTRNRTHGSDFFPFSFLVWEVPTIVARCFCVRFWPRERIDLRRWMGTISREVGLFLLATAYWRDWKSYLRV
jgi:hypothetical protein